MRTKEDQLMLDMMEGLINFVATPKPDQDCRDKALRSLIAVRDHLEAMAGGAS